MIIATKLTHASITSIITHSYFSWVGGVWWEHLWSTLLADFKYIVDVIAQSLGCVQVFVTPWTAAFQASLSLISQSLPKFTSIKSVMPSNHLILCCPLLLLPSVFPRIKVFSCESAVRIWWPKYWSFSFSISPSSEYPGLVSFRIDWLDLLVIQGTLKSLFQHHNCKTSVLCHSAFFMVQLSHLYITTGKTIALTRQTFVSKVRLV